MTDRDAELDLPTTASLLDLPEQAILRWAEKGALPSNGTAGERRFARRDVLDWAKHMGMRLPGGVEVEPKQKTETNALAASLRRGAIVTGLTGDSAIEVLEDFVEKLPDLENLNIRETSKGELTSRLIARERLASTAVGSGFAVPHCRNPLGQDIGRSVVLLGRLHTPIDWNAIDGHPVDSLLLILSKNLETQLELLRRAALALRVESVRDLVRSSEDLDRICEAIAIVPE